MDIIMKKIINISIVILAISIIVSGALNVFATEDMPYDKENDKVTLFEKQGDYIKEDPFKNTTPHGSWNLLGNGDVITNTEDKYPISISNTINKDVFYYIAGSNSLKDLASSTDPIKFLENDFVFEYVLDYDNNSDGHISLVLAYNYSYYVDAYISSQGTGDIAIITNNNSQSYLSDNSILNTENADALIKAIYGNNKSAVLRDKMIVSVRVTVDENKMPKKICMYLNGCFVAETNEAFAQRVSELTPEYVIDAEAKFPTDKLGNIIALKSTGGSIGEIGSVTVYSVDNDNYTPSGKSAMYYDEIYGNASFNPEDYPDLEIETEDESQDETEESSEDKTNSSSGTEEASTDAYESGEEQETDSGEESTDEISEETTKKNRGDKDDDEDEYYLDVIPTLCLVFGGASLGIIIIALVILKLRTRNK